MRVGNRARKKAQRAEKGPATDSKGHYAKLRRRQEQSGLLKVAYVALCCKAQ